MINKHSVFIWLLYNIVTKTVELGTTVQVDGKYGKGDFIIKSRVIIIPYTMEY